MPLEFPLVSQINLTDASGALCVVDRAACVQCLAVSQWFSERMVQQSVVQPQMPRHGFIGKRGSQNAERTTDIPSLS